MEKDNSKRKCWTYKETILFLNCYAARKEEFEHSRKKKYAFANVLKDMARQGLKDTSITEAVLVSKLRSLLRAFQAAKDNNRSKGANSYFSPYADLMEEIFGDNFGDNFGDKPALSYPHILNSAEPDADESYASYLEAKLLLKRKVAAKRLKRYKEHLDFLKEIELKKLELLNKLVEKDK